MVKQTKQTVSGILRADDIRTVLSDIDTEAGSLEAIAAVVLNTEGDLYIRYFGSLPEALGLLEVGRQLLLKDVSEDGD